MKARFLRFAGVRSRARRASTVGLFLTLFATAAQAQPGTPEQRRACSPDVYRLCAGEIPNARAITACLRRQKASLSRPALRCSSSKFFAPAKCATIDRDLNGLSACNFSSSSVAPTSRG
jgi:hypothetical protein